jgi:hypothetical protein
MVGIMAFSSDTIDFDVVYSLVGILIDTATVPFWFLAPTQRLRRCPIDLYSVESLDTASLNSVVSLSFNGISWRTALAFRRRHLGGIS